VRENAEEAARQTAAEARATAQEIVEEGERRRAEIEAVVGELEARRDHTVGELERLRTELGSTIGTHAAPARAQTGTAKKRDERTVGGKDVGTVTVRAKS
jgi:hypothetical protein